MGAAVSLRGLLFERKSGQSACHAPMLLFCTGVFIPPAPVGQEEFLFCVNKWPATGKCLT